MKGNPRAPVAVLEFSDFQCPFCGTFALSILPELEREFLSSAQVLFALRHLPIESLHPEAPAIAVAAHCAGESGHFWDLHDALYRTDRRAQMQALPTLLDALPGLNRTAYEECIGTRGLDAVAADLVQARNLGVRSTPTFFIGVLTAAGLHVTARVEGAKNLEVFREAIQTALRESAKLDPQS